MKVIAFTRPVPIDAQDSLVELELAQPEFGPSDLLVKVRAVSVNLMGTKVRGARHQGSASDNTAKPRVLGWDAASVVLDKGAAVIAFGVGDTVYYRRVGSPQIERRIRRPWTNGSSDACQTRSGFAEAAALPLTSTTGELLFGDRVRPRSAGTAVPENVFRIEYSRPPGILRSDQSTH